MFSAQSHHTRDVIAPGSVTIGSTILKAAALLIHGDDGWYSGPKLYRLGSLGFYAHRCINGIKKINFFF